MVLLYLDDLVRLGLISILGVVHFRWIIGSQKLWPGRELSTERASERSHAYAIGRPARMNLTDFFFSPSTYLLRPTQFLLQHGSRHFPTILAGHIRIISFIRHTSNTKFQDVHAYNARTSKHNRNTTYPVCSTLWSESTFASSSRTIAFRFLSFFPCFSMAQ